MIRCEHGMLNGLCVVARCPHYDQLGPIDAADAEPERSVPAGPTTLLGIDLGTRRCAAVAVPTDWDGVWSRVRSIVVGEPMRRDATDAERARRTDTIASQLVRFARETGASLALIESYAYSQHTAAHTLGELGGVVRLELLRAGLEIRTVQMSTARKLLLGKVPRAEAGMACYATLRTAGARFETTDEAAAFTVANVELAERGGYCFAQEQEEIDAA